MQDAIRRLRIVTDAPGAQQAARDLRGVASAQREVASASKMTERAYSASETWMQRNVRQFQTYARGLRQYAKEQAALRDVTTGFRAGVRDHGEFYGGGVQYSAQAAAAGIRAVTPLVGAAGREAGTAARIISRELAPALGTASKEAALTAAVVSRDLSPAFIEFARALAPIGLGWVGYVAIVAGIGSLVKSVHAGIEAYAEFETRQTILTNKLNATGYSAGRTAGQIDELVRSIGNINETRQASQALLSFGGVSRDVFDDALRAANDLSATGFGGVVQSARAMGRALTSPAEGLKALEAAGVRVGVRQRALIVDMMETGHQAEAQRLILKAVADQVGGAGAARSGTLAGAWRNLADEMQRGREMFGETIVHMLRLVDVVQALADAARTFNDIRLSPEASKFLQAISTTPLFGPFAMATRALIPAEDTTARLREQHMREAVAIAASFEPMRRQQDAYDAVVIALEKEIEALGKSRLERAIEEQQRKAGVAAASEEGRAIAELVTRKHQEAEAVQKAEQARRQAEARQRRDAEFVRRTGEQLETELEKFQQRREALGMSERAALSAAKADAILARFRERSIALAPEEIARIRERAAALAEEEVAVRRLEAAKKLLEDVQFETDTALFSSSERQMASRLRQIYSGEWRSHMNDAIVEQIRFNDVMRQTSSILESNIASSLADVTLGAKSFRDAFADTSKVVLRAIEEMAIKMYILRPLMSGLGGLFSGGGGFDLGGLFGGLFGGSGTGLSLTRLGGLYETGAAFDAGRVVPFAGGGVIDRPILFPMANGMGLAGEAGPEAVIPLRRGRDGRLGVVAHDARPEERTVTVHAPVTVIAPEPQKFNQSRGQVSRTIGQAWQRAQRFN